MTEEVKNNENVEEAEVVNEQLSEIDLLKEQVDALKDQNLRLVAENQNMIRRLKNEHEENVKRAFSKFAGDLIDPIEILFVAADSVTEEQKSSEHFKNFYQGVDMTRLEFLKAFEKHGLVRINPVNEKFDHNFHEAVSQVKDETKESNTIIQVLKAGYILHGKVLRPAIVVVSS